MNKTPLSEKIQSLRATMGVDYDRPDPSRLNELVEALWNNPKPLEYLQITRGFTPDTIRHFKLGFDTSRNAISIPIFKGGVLCNIKYRLLDNPEQRYTGEKNAEPWMFNEEGVSIAQARGKGVLVVEGEFDCIAVWQSGVKNVISPSSGKDSYGIWLEKIDNLKRVFIGFDNDEGGKTAATKLAERLGVEKCFDINYQDCKDANEYLTKHTKDEFISLLSNAKPFTRQKFKNLGDIIQELRKGVDNSLQTTYIPGVKFQKGWMSIISGRSNVGKTSYVMNIANEFAERGVGVLIMPFERGIESVGQRFLQVRHKASPADFEVFRPEDWDDMVAKDLDLPVYFSMPSKEETVDFIIKSKRYFNTQIVIIDHLDYMVRQLSGGNRGDAIMDTLQQLKRIAEDAGVVLLIVSHIRKIEKAGEFISRSRKPNIEDLKGSSSLYQDPEVVVMLSETQEDDEISVDVLKNKGEMLSKNFHFNRGTGEYKDLGKHVTSTHEANKILEQNKKESEELWNKF